MMLDLIGIDNIFLVNLLSVNNDGLEDQEEENREEDASEQSEDDEDPETVDVTDVTINTNGQNILDDDEFLEITAPPDVTNFSGGKTTRIHFLSNDSDSRDSLPYY